MPDFDGPDSRFSGILAAILLPAIHRGAGRFNKLTAQVFCRRFRAVTTLLARKTQCENVLRSAWMPRRRTVEPAMVTGNRGHRRFSLFVTLWPAGTDEVSVWSSVSSLSLAQRGIRADLLYPICISTLHHRAF